RARLRGLRFVPLAGAPALVDLGRLERWRLSVEDEDELQAELSDETRRPEEQADEVRGDTPVAIHQGNAVALADEGEELVQLAVRPRPAAGPRGSAGPASPSRSTGSAGRPSVTERGDHRQRGRAPRIQDRPGHRVTSLARDAAARGRRRVPSGAPR